MSNGRVKLMNILMNERKRSLRGWQKQTPPKRWNIVSGDTVQVIDRKHPEYGKQGKVSAVLREKLRVIVEGVNIYPRKVPANPERGTKEEIVNMERSMHYSNVNLVDPVTGFPTKITWSYLEDGKKVRISKRSGAIIPKPEVWRLKPKNLLHSEDSDTVDDGDVWETTYVERRSKWEDMREELVNKMEANKLTDDA